jgi:hypothetical protein
MLPSLDNFVSYGTDVLKVRPDYRQKVLDMYRTALTSPQLGDNDKINGCKLAESMLLNLHGHIDDVCLHIHVLYLQLPLITLVQQLQDIIAIAADHIDKGETSAFRLANLETLINASAALHFIEAYKPGHARIFFDRWFAAINSENKLPRVHDKKLSILALCKLLEMEAGAIPDGLRDGWPGIVVGALNIFKALPQAVAST